MMDDNDENVIVLEGFGQITKWRFPEDIKTCPMLRCDYSFSTHSACRNHFKKVHAKKTVCCPECKKIYVASSPHNFLNHFQNAHPKSRMPFNFGEASTSTTSTDHGDTGKNNENDDNVITLKACGHITKWRVPADIRKCPVLSCQQVFEDRPLFIAHYKEAHANGSIFCSVCEKPLRVSHGGKDFIRHYQIKHPNHQIPFEFGHLRNPTKKIIRPLSMVCICIIQVNLISSLN